MDTGAEKKGIALSNVNNNMDFKSPDGSFRGRFV